MGRETAIDRLAPEHKKMLDDKLFENGFNGYVDLEKWLQDLGYEIGKSSIHRYGQKLERKLAAVQASTQAAIMIAEASPDDGDAQPVRGRRETAGFHHGREVGQALEIGKLAGDGFF